MKRRVLLGWLLVAVVLAVTYRTLAQGLVQASRDLSGHDFPETWYLIERWRRLELPLWLPHERLGQPFLALWYTQALYLPRVLTALWLGHVVGPNVMHLFHAGWAFAGCALAARRLGLRGASAFVAAAPFSLSPFYVELAQNLSFASTAAWAGWVLAGALEVRRRPGPRAVAWLALAVGGATHAGAPEILLWETLAATLVVLAGSRRAWPWLALGLGWGGALGAVVALPALELARAFSLPGTSTPGHLEWSVSPIQLLSVGLPDVDLPRGPYWLGDDQHFAFTLFVGSAAALLALVGATRRRGGPLVALVLVCFLLGLGKHLAVARWLLELPPLELLRYPVKYALGGLFGLSLLGGLGARRLAALARRGSGWATRAGLLGFSLGLWAASRLPDVRPSLGVGATWGVLVAVAVALTASRPWLLAIAVAVELMVVPHRQWERLPAERLVQSSPLAARLRGQEVGRVSVVVDVDDADLPACGPWDAEDAGARLLLEGRQRLSVLRFIEEDLRATGGYGFRDPWRLERAFRAGASAFALASTTHFVRHTASSPGFAGPTPELEPSLVDLWVWRWDGARPRGWVGTAAEVVSDQEAFSRLERPLPPNLVLVDRGPTLEGACGSPPVHTAELSPERVVQDLEACAEGYVVLADAWYPGWRVWVDGVEREPARAFGFLRAVAVTGGRHRVEWVYRPTSVLAGAALSGTGLLAALLTLALTRPRRVSKRSSLRVG